MNTVTRELKFWFSLVRRRTYVQQKCWWNITHKHATHVLYHKCWVFRACSLVFVWKWRLNFPFQFGETFRDLNTPFIPPPSMKCSVVMHYRVWDIHSSTGEWKLALLSRSRVSGGIGIRLCVLRRCETVCACVGERANTASRRSWYVSASPVLFITASVPEPLLSWGSVASTGGLLVCIASVQSVTHTETLEWPCM
jgi:hypothetical protein